MYRHLTLPLLLAGTSCVPANGILDGASFDGTCLVGESSWSVEFGPVAGEPVTSPVWNDATGDFKIYRGSAVVDGQPTVSSGAFVVCEDVAGCTVDAFPLVLGDGWMELGASNETIYMSAHLIASGPDAWVGRCGGVTNTTAGSITLERL